MKIGKKEFDLENHCYVMGILNVTPDSFSDGGKWNRIDAAKKHTGEMIRDGACGVFNPEHLRCFFTVEEKLSRIYQKEEFS